MVKLYKRSEVRERGKETITSYFRERKIAEIKTELKNMSPAELNQIIDFVNEVKGIIGEQKK